MKLKYASLGFTAVAAQLDVFTVFEEAMSKVYQETNNGFKINLEPYWTAEMENGWDIETGHEYHRWYETFNSLGEGEPIKSSIFIQNLDNGVKGETDISGEFEKFGDEFISLWFALGGPDVSDDGKFDRFHYIDEWSFTGSEAGVNAIGNGSMKSSNKNGDEGIEKFDGEFNADVGMSEGTVSLEMSLEMNNEISGYSEQFKEDNTMDFNLGFTIGADMDKCISYREALEMGAPMKGKKCVIEMEMEYESLQFGEGSMSMDMNMLPVKLALEITLPDEREHTIVLRGEEKNFKKPELLSVANWYGIYYHEGTSTRKAFKENSQFLVARWPGVPQWENTLIPHLEKKFEPHANFFMKLGESFNNLMMGEDSQLGHFIFYFDQFTAVLTNEFDLSKFMKLSRFNTQIPSLMGMDGDFNEMCQDMLKGLNEEIVSFLQCPEMSEFYPEMRGYVKNLASNNGKQEFKAYWIEDLA